MNRSGKCGTDTGRISNNPIIDKIGNKRWFKKPGQLHREDGPAVEYCNGDKCWIINGLPHRTDGPAHEYTDGTKFWYCDGQLHRKDGPAIEFTSGSRLWYLKGKFLTKENWEREILAL